VDVPYLVWFLVAETANSHGVYRERGYACFGKLWFDVTGGVQVRSYRSDKYQSNEPGEEFTPAFERTGVMTLTTGSKTLGVVGSPVAVNGNQSARDQGVHGCV
jgi:hypothetical protein